MSELKFLCKHCKKSAPKLFYNGPDNYLVCLCDHHAEKYREAGLDVQTWPSAAINICTYDYIFIFNTTKCSTNWYCNGTYLLQTTRNCESIYGEPEYWQHNLKLCSIENSLQDQINGYKANILGFISVIQR